MGQHTGLREDRQYFSPGVLQDITNDGQRPRIRPKFLGPPAPANTFPTVLVLGTSVQWGTAPPKHRQASVLALPEADSQNNAKRLALRQCPSLLLRVEGIKNPNTSKSEFKSQLSYLNANHKKMPATSLPRLPWVFLFLDSTEYPNLYTLSTHIFLKVRSCLFRKFQINTEKIVCVCE